MLTVQDTTIQKGSSDTWCQVDSTGPFQHGESSDLSLWTQPEYTFPGINGRE